jgi:hypothetical protein
MQDMKRKKKGNGSGMWGKGKIYCNVTNPNFKSNKEWQKKET